MTPVWKARKYIMEGSPESDIFHFPEACRQIPYIPSLKNTKYIKGFIFKILNN